MKKNLSALLAVILVGVGSPALQSETLTFTTVFPAPSGVYQQIITTGGGAKNTILARDGGAVGIGTTNPRGSLHVNAPGQSAVLISGGSDNGRTYSALYLDDSTTTNRWVVAHKNRQGMPDQDALHFVKEDPTSANVAMALQPNGLVGIGTLDPEAILHVHNALGQGNIKITGISDAGETYSALYLGDDNTDPWNSWVAAHWKFLGTPYQDTFVIAKWSDSSFITALIIKPNADMLLSGNVYSSTPGNGFIAKSPNGLICKRMGIDDSGNIVASAVACP